MHEFIDSMLLPPEVAKAVNIAECPFELSFVNYCPLMVEKLFIFLNQGFQKQLIIRLILMCWCSSCGYFTVVTYYANKRNRYFSELNSQPHNLFQQGVEVVEHVINNS